MRFVMRSSNGPALQRRGPRRGMVAHSERARVAGHVRWKRKLGDTAGQSRHRVNGQQNDGADDGEDLNAFLVRRRRAAVLG